MKEAEIKRLPSLGFACREALNTLCTNLMFSGDNIRKIMLTSSHASEGKSFLTMNIAYAMAQMEKKVVLLDVDLRKSVLNSRYDIEFEGSHRASGLVHYLAGMVDEKDILYSTNVENMYMVPCGREVKNPLTLINSPRFVKLLEYLQQTMDYVFVDAPPVLIVSDALQIAKYCDGTLFVVGSSDVHRQELQEAKKLLDQSGCNILGTVLNMARLDSYINRKYYHKYCYYNDYNNYYNTDPSASTDKSRKV